MNDAELAEKAQVRIVKKSRGANGEFLPDATWTSTVGVIHEVSVVSNCAIVSVLWAFTGPYVADYVISPIAGTVVPIQDFTTNPIQVAWTVGSGSAPYTISAWVTLDCGMYGGRVFVQETITITAPTVVEFGSGTGVVAVGDNAAGLTFLQFVGSASPVLSGYGIIIDALVNGTQAANGTIAYIQMCTNQRFIQQFGSGQKMWSLNDVPAVDIGQYDTPIYQDETVALAAGSTDISIQVKDAPGFQLNYNVEFGAVGAEDGPPEVYETFLMFQPAGGIWVTLAVLVWYWRGEASNVSGSWELSNQSCSDDPNGTAASDLPTWLNNTAEGYWM